MNYKALLLLVPLAVTIVVISHYLQVTSEPERLNDHLGALDPNSLKSDDYTVQVEKHQQALEQLKDSLSLAEISQMGVSSEVHQNGRRVLKQQNVEQPWTLSAPTTDIADFYLDGSIKNYEPVTLARHDTANRVSVGDNLVIPLPEGLSVEVSVVKSSENSMGGYTWQGYLKGHNDDYPVIFTEGATSSFATITTPTGSYTMESVNGLGWIYQNPSMDSLNPQNFSDQLELADR